MNQKQKKVLYRILIAAALTGALMLFLPGDMPNLLRGALFLIPYLIIGYDILWKAIRGIGKKQFLDENFLMAVATMGAMLLGEYAEGVAVMLFYQIGELFQSYAVGKSRSDIGALMDLRPDEAFVERDGRLESIDPEEVETGTLIIVRPGERIPIDGIVREGSALLDTAALTGESRPVAVAAGDVVQSGVINRDGVLRIETTCEFGDSTASRILDLVENAGMRKARTEQFISRFARVYTPVVCVSALILALGMPLGRLLLGMPADWQVWIYRALTFLVISCPCAVVISIPLTFFAAVGGASREGILVKGTQYLELLSRTKTVMMDKTGTLTEGVFAVRRVALTPEAYRQGLDEEGLLLLCAGVEKYSRHPIAESLRKAAKDAEGLSVSDVEEIRGKGVCATVDGARILAGNAGLLAANGICEDTDALFAESDAEGSTCVYVAKDGVCLGRIEISDAVKAETSQAISALRRQGVLRLIMLTGDSEETANAVAAKAGIDEVHAELLPQDKVALVEQEISESSAPVVFVGDGINDAPVLVRSDIGIAMGGVGSDAAIEAADIVLMNDDPSLIARAMQLSSRCMRIVYENIVFAIGVKLVCLVLSAIGLGNMWLAIFADVGVMVIAVLNAVRALRAPGRRQASD